MPTLWRSATEVKALRMPDIYAFLSSGRRRLKSYGKLFSASGELFIGWWPMLVCRRPVYVQMQPHTSQ